MRQSFLCELNVNSEALANNIADRINNLAPDSNPDVDETRSRGAVAWGEGNDWFVGVKVPFHTKAARKTVLEAVSNNLTLLQVYNNLLPGSFIGYVSSRNDEEDRTEGDTYATLFKVVANKEAKPDTVSGIFVQMVVGEAKIYHTGTTDIENEIINLGPANTFKEMMAQILVQGLEIK